MVGREDERDICLQHANEELSKRKFAGLVFIGGSSQSLEVVWPDKLV